MKKNKRVDKTCIECKNIDGIRNKAYEKYLCNNCEDSDKYKLICKTSIKNDYYLNDNDIVDVTVFEVAHPQYKTKTMYLYNLKEIKDKFCEKYNTNLENMDDVLEYKKNKKVNRRIDMAQKKEFEITTIRDKLLNECVKFGLTIRDDSKLCQGYIDGTIKGLSIEAITKRMCEMKYLHEYNDFQNYFNKAKKSQEKELHAGYFPDVPLFDHAEMLVLEEIGGYPVDWPWL